MSPATANRIERIMKRDGKVLSVSPRDTAAAAAIRMTENECGSLIVVDNRKIVGILSERDIISKVVANNLDARRITVGEIMTRKVVAVTMETPISKAQQIMAQHCIRHLPIVEEGLPIGMISSRDILAHQLAAVKAIAQRQTRILNELEQEHPGITALETDPTGRIVI